jgi:hypothetical protein
MNQGTQGYRLTKKTEGRKSRDTVSLKNKFYLLLKVTKLSFNCQFHILLYPTFIVKRFCDKNHFCFVVGDEAYHLFQKSEVWNRILVKYGYY